MQQDLYYQDGSKNILRLKYLRNIILFCTLEKASVFRSFVAENDSWN
jgi:hypothetical protein